jgi:hypothetical protein
MMVQGRQISEADLAQIRGLVAGHPDWTRRRLSIELCERWSWRNPAGRHKDMSCRNLLLKLHRQGLIELPAPTRRPPQLNGRMKRTFKLDESPVECRLSELGTVSQVPVHDDVERRRLFQHLLRTHHYLGHGQHVGENIGYLAVDGSDRPLGCMLFGAPAWQVSSRDRFIGWSAEQRRRNLLLVTGNTRFLILPWVRVKCLASHLLGLTLRRLNTDWSSRYGHEVQLVETFVDRSRFIGTCYRAANWRLLGKTTGRTRQDRHRRIQVPRKDVYVYVLNRRFREVLHRSSRPPGPQELANRSAENHQQHHAVRQRKRLVPLLQGTRAKQTPRTTVAGRRSRRGLFRATVAGHCGRSPRPSRRAVCEDR